jgi:hypothetical protein
VEKNGSGKRSSLLLYGYNYSYKSFMAQALGILFSKQFTTSYYHYFVSGALSQK